MRRVILAVVALGSLTFGGCWHMSHANSPGIDAITTPDTAQPVDWVTVASIVTSIITAIEAIFNGVTKLVTLFRKPPIASETKESGDTPGNATQDGA